MLVWNYFAYVMVSMAAGFASALLGIGGGIVLVPLLLVLFPISVKSAMATSLAYIGPVAFYGALIQWRLGGEDVRWTLAAIAVPAGLIGASVGAYAKVHISPVYLRVIFGILMVVMGVRLALSPWTGGKEVPAAGGYPPPVESVR
jgi:uncharacterized membrane protein YfcA